MSLENPNIIEKIRAWPYLRIALTIAGLIVLIGLVLFVIDRCDAYRTKKGTDATTKEIVNIAVERANVNAQIGNLKLKEAELGGKLEGLQEQLTDEVFGLEEVKKETNAAIANYNKALNTNSNVNRSIEDLENVLRRLEQ